MLAKCAFRAGGFAVVAALVASAAFALSREAPTGSPLSEGTAKYLPVIEGWTQDGDAMVYDPETLFEYIDGAADAYIAYEFEELAALSYAAGEKRSITVEIYRHRDLRNAFGIYSQERPRAGHFVDVGTQGYYDTGVLNFFQDRYYVKVMGFHLADADRPLLTDTAMKIAERIGAPPAFPPILACFPTEGRVANSERFISRDVLGHGFLHSAYAADYEAVPAGDSAQIRLFLFEGNDESDARRMLEDYLELAGVGPAGRGGDAGANGAGGRAVYRFLDPRRTTGEPANLRLSGRFMWGLFSGDAATADLYLEKIEKKLREGDFIE